jgi:hypothetical protein
MVGAEKRRKVIHRVWDPKTPILQINLVARRDELQRIVEPEAGKKAVIHLDNDIIFPSASRGEKLHYAVHLAAGDIPWLIGKISPYFPDCLQSAVAVEKTKNDRLRRMDQNKK